MISWIRSIAYAWAPLLIMIITYPVLLGSPSVSANLIAWRFILFWLVVGGPIIFVVSIINMPEPMRKVLSTAIYIFSLVLSGWWMKAIENYAHYSFLDETLIDKGVMSSAAARGVVFALTWLAAVLLISIQFRQTKSAISRSE